MSSRRSGSLRGEQTPRVKLMPRIDDLFHADQALKLAAGYGLVADEWQELVIEGWLGSRRSKWAAPRCGLSVPRQNGKNGALEIRELYGMVALGEKFLHTAHEVKTARKAFVRLMHFFGKEANDPDAKFPELNALVVEIRKTNGQEAIILSNGGSIEFIARSKGSGRGFTVDVLVLDEAQELSDDTLAALRPTISSAPLANPQIILTGTPPSPVMNGEVFTRYRDLGVKGKDARLCWLEWSCAFGVDVDDRRNWEQSNPALGYRLSIDVVSDEHADMDAETFARERLGVWDEASALAIFGAGRWQACCVPKLVEGAEAFGIAVSRDRKFACISGAGMAGDRLQVKPLRHGNGVGWIEDSLAELLDGHDLPVVIDKGGPAAYLIPILKEAGFNVIEAGLGDYADACARIYDEAQPGGTLAHDDNPVLNAAVSSAYWRDAGDRRVWGRKNADISPLESVTLAVLGATQSDGPPVVPMAAYA